MREAVFSHYRKDEFAEALAAVEVFEGAEDEQSDLVFWRMCLLCRLGRTDEAIDAFEDSLRQGLWWSGILLEDSDLDSARSDPRWSGLASESAEMAERAAAVDLDPVVIDPIESLVRGTVVYFHGAGSHPAFELPQFTAAVERGFRLVGLFGSQPLSRSRWMWKADVDFETARLSDSLNHLSAPVVLAGFSQGAKVAAKMVWLGKVKASGLILVAPSFNVRDADLLESAHPAPAWIVTGEQDASFESTRCVAEKLAAAGVPHRLDVREGLGHDFPDDFDRTLPLALKWILEEGHA